MKPEIKDPWWLEMAMIGAFAIAFAFVLFCMVVVFESYHNALTSK